MSRRHTYPSDLTDAQWAIIEVLLPPSRRGGRPEKRPRREILDAILYVVRTGCSWRQLKSVTTARLRRSHRLSHIIPGSFADPELAYITAVA